MAAGAQLAQDIQAIDGISVLLRFAATPRGTAWNPVLGIDPLAYPRVSGMEFSQGVAAQAYPPWRPARHYY